MTLGLGLLVMLRLLKRFAPRIPGAAVVVILAVLLSAVLDLGAHGFATIGRVSAGLPLPKRFRSSSATRPVLRWT